MKLSTQRFRASPLGFTLIELLVVIGILAVLLAIVLIAINPARQFSQANNTKRSSDVNALLNAVHQYAADNRGDLSGLGTISNDCTTPTAIADTGTTDTFCTALVTEYIAALPSDPTDGTGAAADGEAVPDTSCDGLTAWNTGYTICQTPADNRITITAPGTEIPPATEIIDVTR